MTGKILSIQVVIFPVIYWSVLSSSTKGEGGVKKRIGQSATSFTLLGYMIIWCKIQVIINPIVYALTILNIIYCRYVRRVTLLARVKGMSLHNLDLETNAVQSNVENVKKNLKTTNSIKNNIKIAIYLNIYFL